MTVIGIVAENIASSEDQSYQDGNQTKQAKLAKIKINLNRQGSGTSGVVQSDSSLARLGRAAVGKNVSEIRVLIAMIMFVIVLIAEGGIIYGAISGAITAPGRNPFANKIISGELIKIITMALVVLILGLGGVYAILRV